jgi:hypothetical protein
VIIYAVIDDALSPDFPLGVDLEVFVRREDAERFGGRPRHACESIKIEVASSSPKRAIASALILSFSVSSADLRLTSHERIVTDRSRRARKSGMPLMRVQKSSELSIVMSGSEAWPVCEPVG